MNQILCCDWLPKWARWSLNLGSGLLAVSREIKPHSKSFINKACLIKMAGYWPHSVCASLWTSTPSQSINMQKKKLPKSSHLDLTLGQ